MVWLCNTMSLLPLLYTYIQGGVWAKKIVVGDCHNKLQVYQWDWIEENLPFSQKYHTTLPQLQNMLTYGHLESDVLQYADDLCIVANSLEQAWLASSHMAKGLCWLGLQDAARKQRRACQRPGAWAGLVIASDGNVVTKSVTQEHWIKTIKNVQWIGKQTGVINWFAPDLFGGLNKELDSSGGENIHCKTTESLVGFIVYVFQTYESMVPYLKGIYFTFNSWRKGGDNDG